MKVILEKSKCLGCGSCVAVCPKFWKIGPDGKAHLLNSKFDSEKNQETLEVEKPGCNHEAVEVCPAQCIHITD